MQDTSAAMLLLTALWLTRSRDSLPKRASVIVILGCKVHMDGNPSIALQRRIEAGVALFQSDLAHEILVTGGAVNGAPNEAKSMSQALQRLGVPKGAILLEDQAQNTWDNAIFCAPLIRGPAIIVSDDWHLPRALHLFERAGIQAQGFGVRGERSWRWKCILREVLGYWLTRLRTRQRTWRRPKTG
ncbi:MAG: uncharacterized SAM-binding protein YcdF (DUF218 family) [Cognaticolwellia sp.]|jgi:uncharacterized SAM-binding protein YcdF (DUF218 family)